MIEPSSKRSRIRDRVGAGQDVGWCDRCGDRDLSLLGVKAGQQCPGQLLLAR